MNWANLIRSTAIMVGATVAIKLVARTRLVELASEKFGVSEKRSPIVAGLLRTALPVGVAVFAPHTALYTIPLAQASAIDFVATSIKDSSNK